MALKRFLLLKIKESLAYHPPFPELYPVVMVACVMLARTLGYKRDTGVLQFARKIFSKRVRGLRSSYEGR